MAFGHWKNLFTVVFILFTFLASHQKLVAATRPLGGEHWLKKDGRLVIQSLRSPVPSSGNPCSNIPRGGSGKCKLNAMNIAGSVAPVPPAFPDLVVKVGVASAGNSESHDKDQSS